MKTWVLRSGLLLSVVALVATFGLLGAGSVSAFPVSPEIASAPVSDVHADEASGMNAEGVLAILLSLPFLFGTTLAADKVRAVQIGDENDLPVIASDIIYEGAAVGVVPASGHARPLAAGDRFAGFAMAKVDNSAGAAAAKNVKVLQSGKVQLPVSGAVITDMGQPVYATDDDTFVFSPVGGVFIGFVHRFVSSGVVIVAFNALSYRDPWGHKTIRETLTGTKTFDAQDCGKLFCVTADGDGDALTLPAIADGLAGITILAIGAFGTTAVTLDPGATDMILAPDVAGVDNTNLVLTKATQQRGDFITLSCGDADGYLVTEMRGIWA